MAFPMQQWLQESVSVLRYTYIACLVEMKKCIKTLLLLLFGFEPTFLEVSMLAL
jgi:hypothetical protein